MKKNHTRALLVGATLLAGVSGMAMSDGKDSILQSWFSQTTPGIDKVTTDLYQEECGSCHLAYQPGLLPAQSWEQIMGSLNDHFGENAELLQDDANTIRNFLLNNAAGRVNFGLPNKFMAAQKGKPYPLRITEMHYFRHEHDELGPDQVQKNPEVKSLSQCNRCHQGARQGLYDEHDVIIPGFGRWDD